MFNLFKKILKREDIERKLIGRMEGNKMGKLIIKDGKLVEDNKINQPQNIQPIPPDILEQMRQETELNKQRMEQERTQMIQPQEEEMLPEDMEESVQEQEQPAMTGRQQYEQEMNKQEQSSQEQQVQDFNIIVNLVMIGGLPMKINIPGQYVEEFITKLNNAIDRQLHFNVGTQVIVTKNILYYSLE